LIASAKSLRDRRAPALEVLDVNHRVAHPVPPRDEGTIVKEVHSSRRA
jgi:hypothetical protein